MFSIITMASSTTKPVEMVSAISDRLFRLKPSRYMTPNVPTSESGTATAGIIVAAALRRKRKITSTTSATASTSSNCTSSHRRADGRRAVGEHRDVDRGGSAPQLRQQPLDAVDHLDDVRAGLALDVQDHGGASFIHAACCTFSASSTTSATSDSRTGAPSR